MVSNRQWARDPLAVDLPQVFLALSRMAPVSLIATPVDDLKTCECSASVGEFLMMQDMVEYDYIPVCDGESIIGLLNRSTCESVDTTITVEQGMSPLSSANLISADAGILSFVSTVDRSPCRLLVDQQGISGMVTAADLNALPVRPVLFSLATSFELLMADRIRRALPNPEIWLTHLSEGRRGKITEKHESLREKNMHTDLLEATEFCDKGDILRRAGLVPERLRESAAGDLRAMRELRDVVSHAGGYADSREQVIDLARKVQLYQSWIKNMALEFTAS